jgi:hypothetical protein
VSLPTLDVPRGFRSTTDSPVCYFVYANTHGKPTKVIFRCQCGLEREVVPEDGLVTYRHRFWKCKLHVILNLEGYTDIFLTPKQRKQRYA